MAPRSILHGEIFDEAYAEALRIADERGLTFVHPFDDLEVMAGQGTVALELLADAPGRRHAGRADRRRRPDLRHRRRRQGAASPASSWSASRPSSIPSHVRQVRARAAALRRRHDRRGHRGQGAGHADRRDRQPAGRRHPARPRARHRDARSACSSRPRRPSPKGAGAAGLAALLAHPERFAGRTVGLVLTGGNIDTHLLANVLLRDLARSGPDDAPADPAAGPAGRARGGDEIVRRAPGQHRRGLPPAHLHQPAGQGRGDRRRVRGARRRPSSSG